MADSIVVFSPEWNDPHISHAVLAECGHKPHQVPTLGFQMFVRGEVNVDGDRIIVDNELGTYSLRSAQVPFIFTPKGQS